MTLSCVFQHPHVVNVSGWVSKQVAEGDGRCSHIEMEWETMQCMLFVNGLIHSEDVSLPGCHDTKFPWR